MKLWPLVGFVGAALLAREARAGSFDAVGDYHADPDAVVFESFTAPSRYLPDNTDAKCQDPMYVPQLGPEGLEGGDYVTLGVKDGCAERFAITLPAGQASYRASLWMRHGAVDAWVTVLYADGSGLDGISAALTPTGRTTTDGWVELATNDVPVDGDHIAHAYLKIDNYSSVAGTDVDALEIVRRGDYVGQSDCAGLGDPACGPEQVCIWNRCVLPRAALPVLPSDELRNEMIDILEGQLRIFYGGRRSRQLYLPAALAEMEKMRSSSTATELWTHWAAAIHALHDWHTDTNLGITGFVGPRHRLNACFFEGDADLSHDVWPKDPRYPDILVSHAGPGAAGLKAGDRLLAVDGLHPIEWSAGLGRVNYGFHVATDPEVFSDYAEQLGGAPWSSSAILHFATELTVLRCDASGACNGEPETIRVDTLDPGGGGDDVACDNRPFYHLGDKSPDPKNHYVFGRFFRGPIEGTTPDEAIFGMVWDTLYGGGDPQSNVNKAINDAVTDWKANARGVILDHRAGNGGTLDSATNLTKLVRPAEVAASCREPMEIGGFDGPVDDAAGLALFDQTKSFIPYDVGDPGYAADLPVALVLHRDGSASDYLPFGMKGAPRVRLFGPHPTSGAFSTYDEFFGWGGFNFQIGSGDTIAADGRALIGHGVVPDVVILPKQSDLLAGKDTLFEAALAWVREEIGK